MEPTNPPVRLIPFDDDFVRRQFRDLVHQATREHAAWVDGGGLRTGQPGPLDELIMECEACLSVAQRAKTANEED